MVATLNLFLDLKTESGLLLAFRTIKFCLVMSLKNYLFILPFLCFISGYLLIGNIVQKKTFITPSIVGKQVLKAASILSDANLNMRILHKKEELDLPDGTILSQTPKSGHTIKQNQSVFVVMSQKPPRTPAPRFVGKKLKTILQDVSKKNIRNRSYFFNSKHPTNSCIAQYPSPATLLKQNNVITYIAKEDKRCVLLPDFKGKSLQRVTDFLNRYNITIEITYSSKYAWDRSEETGNEIIIDQRPLAGSIVRFDNQNPITIHLKV